jgi:hypothetical protein
MHAVLIEAVPPRALCPLAKPLQVAAALVLQHVVFARDVEDREGQFGQHLLQRVEFRRLREMRQVPRVQDERRWIGRLLDLGDGRAQGGRDVGVRRFVEPDVTVADLDKPESPVFMRHHVGAIRLPQRRPFQDAAR